jgi:hypothetical protein
LIFRFRYAFRCRRRFHADFRHYFCRFTPFFISFTVSPVAFFAADTAPRALPPLIFSDEFSIAFDIIFFTFDTPRHFHCRRRRVTPFIFARLRLMPFFFSFFRAADITVFALFQRWFRCDIAADFGFRLDFSL